MLHQGSATAIPLDDDIEPRLHGPAYTAETSPQPRPDEWAPFGAPEEILAQAPEAEDGYFAVPEIPHTELE